MFHVVSYKRNVLAIMLKCSVHFISFAPYIMKQYCFYKLIHYVMVTMTINNSTHGWSVISYITSPGFGFFTSMVPKKCHLMFLHYIFRDLLGKKLSVQGLKE